MAPVRSFTAYWLKDSRGSPQLVRKQMAFVAKRDAGGSDRLGSLEDYCFHAIQQHPAFEMMLHGLRKHARLGVASNRYEIFGRKIVRNPLRFLVYDGTFVEIGRYMVRRRTRDLHATLVRLVRARNRSDPFWSTGLRKSIRIFGWNQVCADGRRLIEGDIASRPVQ
jgi:hypothetical protein